MHRLNDIPSLALSGSHAALALPDGGVRDLTQAEVCEILAGRAPVLLCHALLTARPFMARPVMADHLTAPIFDVMELFAFVHPARSVVPTSSGLARVLDCETPCDARAAAIFVRRAAEILLQQLTETHDEDALPIAEMMKKGGWRWGEMVCAALPSPQNGSRAAGLLFSILTRRLPEWHPPRSGAKKEVQPDVPKPNMIDPQKALLMLKEGLGAAAEPRAGQVDYMRDVMEVFTPRRSPSASFAAVPPPPVMLAEADTGIGKTLGYLVPAFLAAEAFSSPVWVVTYTRALQSQIDRETARLIPDEKQRVKKVVLRKGRENYLCLLNFEESLRVGSYQPVLAGLVARWLGRTRDGDIRSGDFPSWLISGHQSSGWLGSLTDRYETCIHSACPHYRRCFVERQRVSSAGADLTIANHALVLSHSLFAAEPQKDERPPYYIFDEGHHIFSAADSAFTHHLTGRAMADLRHWLMGDEAATAIGGRARGWASQGLAPRMEEILLKHKHIRTLLDEVCAAARFLPRVGWRQRIARGHPSGIAEEFLHEIREIVAADARQGRLITNEYSLESEMVVLSQAGALKGALEDLLHKMSAFAGSLEVLDEEEASSCVSIRRVLGRWLEHNLLVWVSMSSRALQEGGLVQWIDRLVVERDDGHEIDIGMCRSALDPARTFAQNILLKSSGTLITSASLRVSREASAWSSAEQRVGAHCLPYPARHIYMASPFDYARQARVFIATDIERDDRKIAQAMALLFSASRGGGLGLFTAVRRLKAAHGVIAGYMRRSGRLLLAQHIDPMATSALMDIFREDEDSCLLGTDALRDGVDVPGRSLRLIAFDRMPWARPDILHRARRQFFGRRSYDDMIGGMRVQQAFGRLIRSQSDHGVFILLDRGFPSRLKGVFPEGVEVERLPLAQILRRVRGFLNG